MNLGQWARGRYDFVCADRRLYRSLTVWRTKTLGEGEDRG